MIKWKQRLYALFLRRVLGPLLDSPSRQILHESIEVSLQEGTFALSNIGLCTSYLNEKVENGGVQIQKARIESITIQLSLIERKHEDPSEVSSLAWRAMTLGSSVSLLAHVEVNGIELEVQPLPKDCRENKQTVMSDAVSDEDDNADTSYQSMLSSYIEAALGSLRLSLTITNLNVKLCHQAEPGTTSWVQLRLPSISYQDMDRPSSLGNLEADSEESQQRNNTKTIFEKSMLFQGITLSAGESSSTGADGGDNPSNLVSTIALVEGTGQVSIRAVEFLGNVKRDDKKRVQQDIEVRINQQVKISVSETSLLQIQAVAKGFGSNQSTANDMDISASERTQRELGSVFSEKENADTDVSRMDEKKLYTIDGIMKQYQEARQLAERNEMRGGILIPSNAFEEGEHIGDGDPRTFDVFFDANEKSFHNYASMMKDSVMTSQEGGKSSSDFVHTKLRLNILGGGIKVSFRGRKAETKTFLGPEEYILLTFNDLEATSSLSRRRTEVAVQVAHLEIDDAQIPHPDGDAPRVEIGNLLCFSEPPNGLGDNGDLLLQPSCISVHLTVNTDAEDVKRTDLELDLKPVEVIYRARTFSHLSTLLSTLSEEKCANHDTQQEDESKKILISVLCAISSFTLTLPLVEENDDMGQLFSRCGHYVDTYSSDQSALGFVLDNLSFEHKLSNDKTVDGASGMETMTTTTLDIHSFLVFASTPGHANGSVRRRNRVVDLFGAAGRLEVDPFIPITIAYKRSTNGTSIAKETFPTVPAFSSFKARQEDEDEDEEIDRVLSEKLSNVDVDSRRALRAKDPQGQMLLEAEQCEAAVMVHIPDIVLDLSKEELEVLLVLINSIQPVTTENSSELDGATSYSPSSAESSSSPAMAVSVAIDAISLCVLDNECPSGRAKWNSQLLRLDKCRAYTILAGSSTRFCRLLSHEATFFEMIDVDLEDCVGANIPPQSVQARAAGLKNRTVMKRSASTVPIFYRSKLFPAISHNSPSILLDVMKSNSNQSERSIFFSVYHMTYRVDPDSRWIEMLQKVVLGLRPSDQNQQKGEDEMTSPDTSYDETSLTRVFLSLADCNLDYTSLRHFNTESRSILRVGDLRFSSNIVVPSASVQAFSLSMADFSWCLCNTRASHSFENSLLPCAGQVMAKTDLVFKANQPRGGYMACPADAVFRDMCSKTILTLESIDAIIVKNKAAEFKSEKMGASKDPGLAISLTLGELSMYACNDSFLCFTETIGELQTKMTAVSNEQMEELNAQMKSKKSEGYQDQAISKESGRPTDVAAIPLDTEDDFMLDGYDWTTIDHKPRASEIPPGEEQAARWFHASPVDDDGLEKSVLGSFAAPSNDEPASPSTQHRIIGHHFPLHDVSDPLGDGDMEATKFAGTDSVVVNARVLLHDIKVKIRFFDGYDWPEYQPKKKRDPTALFVIAELPVDEASNGEGEKLKANSMNDKKSALLGGLLAGGDENAATFGDIPLPEERVRYTLAQHDLRRLSRRTNTYIQVSARGVSLRIDTYCDSTDHRLKSCLSLTLQDFFLAETISSLNPIKMFGEWFNEVEHPRDSNDGLLMLKMVTWDPLFPLTSEGKLASQECAVALTLAPMRCIIDQRAIKFAQALFLGGDKEDKSPVPDWSASLNLVPAPFVRRFRVDPVKLKINYTPQKINTAALHDGCIVELINLSPLDSMILTIHPVEIENVQDFGEAIGSLVGRWLDDIKTTQLYKFLTNARPFEPITNIGGGVVDLFVLPWDAYKNGGSVSRAVRSSVSSLVGNVAHETLTTSSRMTAFVADKMAKATMDSPYHASNTSLPSRPLATPRRVGDTAGHALESLAKGVQAANYKVIIVPYREYRRSGTTGAVRSIARGIPVAVAGPVCGASEALSYTLLGARNQIRPDIRKEEEVVQRGLHYGGI